MTELKAYCKINLGLRVVRRRDDGFHDIETVMMPVRGLHDTVSVEALPDSAAMPEGLGGGFVDPLTTTPMPYPAPRPVFPTDSVLEVSGPLAGALVDSPPEQNICMRALRLVQHEYGIGEAIIRLHKVIPSGAGLGGGSADAAAVVFMINIYTSSFYEGKKLQKQRLKFSETRGTEESILWVMNNSSCNLSPNSSDFSSLQNQPCCASMPHHTSFCLVYKSATGYRLESQDFIPTGNSEFSVNSKQP